MPFELTNLARLDPYEAIIFDLGGVIIDLDYQRTIAAFAQLSGLTPATVAEQVYAQQAQQPLFDRCEMGEISAAEFRAGLRQLLRGFGQRVDCPDAELDAAWNALIVEVPRVRLELLVALRSHRQLFLLSNNNLIHKACCDRLLSERFGNEFGTWETLFDRAYFSHEMGDRKPHPSIFRRVLDEQGLQPEKTLFFEDTAIHVAGARSVGLQAVQIEGEQTIEHYFSS